MERQPLVAPVIQKNAEKKKEQPVGLHSELLWGFKRSGNREEPHEATENQLRLPGKAGVSEKQGERMLAKGIMGTRKAFTNTLCQAENRFANEGWDKDVTLK